MGKQPKKWYATKRFWGVMVTVVGIILKSLVPKSSDVVDQVTPILQPLVIDGISDATIAAGLATFGAGLGHKYLRNKKSKRESADRLKGN